MNESPRGKGRRPRLQTAERIFVCACVRVRVHVLEKECEGWGGAPWVSPEPFGPKLSFYVFKKKKQPKATRNKHAIVAHNPENKPFTPCCTVVLAPNTCMEALQIYFTSTSGKRLKCVKGRHEGDSSRTIFKVDWMSLSHSKRAYQILHCLWSQVEPSKPPKAPTPSPKPAKNFSLVLPPWMSSSCFFSMHDDVFSSNYKFYSTMTTL